MRATERLYELWKESRGFSRGEVQPITRAALLFEAVRIGKIDIDEMKTYIDEIGLMIPIVEN